VKRVLVTGGSGFIGSHVVDALERRGFAPRIYDLRPSPHHAEGSVDTVIGDLNDVEVLTEAAKGCEAIVHLAAHADVGEVAEDPEGAERTNSRGTLAVLQAARATGVRVIYGSTIWVYGDSGGGVLDEESPLGMPAHLYTATKLAGEMYCTSYAELYDVPYTILRFGIPYGPRARPAAVIPIFAAKAAAGDPLTIAGDGKQSRRFVYVEDLADGVARALHEKAENRIYNLAGDETVTILELAEIIRDETRKVEITHTPGRTGDFGGAVISSERAEAELGWAASTPIREGVRRYVDWARDEGVLEPEADPAPVLLPVSDPEPVILPAAPSLKTRLLSGAGVTGLACAVGMCVPLLIAARTDDFGTVHARILSGITLVSILFSLSVLPALGVRVLRTGVMASWTLVVLLILALMPWSKHALHLGRPGIGTLALSAIGTIVAVAVAVAADRYLVAEEPATEEAR
jgi:UDP-glucose 4-epimerase